MLDQLQVDRPFVGTHDSAKDIVRLKNLDRKLSVALSRRDKLSYVEQFIEFDPDFMDHAVKVVATNNLARNGQITSGRVRNCDRAPRARVQKRAVQDAHAAMREVSAGDLDRCDRAARMRDPQQQRFLPERPTHESPAFGSLCFISGTVNAVKERLELFLMNAE